MKSQPADSVPIEITGLTSNTTYSIVMEADNSEGMRENSSTVMLSTNPPGQFLGNTSVEDADRGDATVIKYRIFIDDQLKELHLETETCRQSQLIILHQKQCTK